MKKVNNGFMIIGVMFSCIGLFFFMVFGYLFMKEKNFIDSAFKTNGVVTKIVETKDSDGYVEYDVHVLFSVNGKDYSGSIDYYDSALDEGSEVNIYYNPQNPNEFVGDIDYIDTIMCAVGLSIFSIIGISFLSYEILRRKKIKQLISNKYIIQADIVRVEKIKNDNNINVKYRILATAKSSYNGLTYNFKSDAFWNDLTKIIKEHNIKTISVYVNPQNYKKYYVDVDALSTYIDK